MLAFWQISKDFILKELFFLLDELDELLNVDHSSKGNQYATSFLTCVDEVLELIETSHLDDNVMESKIYQILQHSMTVANCSAEDEKYQITRYSQQVLYEFRSLQDLLEKIEQSPGDISLAVDILRDFLELLEQSVNHSLLRMMVEVLNLYNLLCSFIWDSRLNNSPWIFEASYWNCNILFKFLKFLKDS